MVYNIHHQQTNTKNSKISHFLAKFSSCTTILTAKNLAEIFTCIPSDMQLRFINILWQSHNTQFHNHAYTSTTFHNHVQSQGRQLLWGNQISIIAPDFFFALISMAYQIRYTPNGFSSIVLEKESIWLITLNDE